MVNHDTGPARILRAGTIKAAESVLLTGSIDRR